MFAATDDDYRGTRARGAWPDGAAGPDRGLLPATASVRRALERLCADPIGSSLDGLALVSGVTLARLQRNVRAYSGVTLLKLLMNARLDWVRERLESHEEARSIADLARVTGHSSTAVFSHAYKRRFGEAPTLTRARAFATDNHCSATSQRQRCANAGANGRS